LHAAKPTREPIFLFEAPEERSAFPGHNRGVPLKIDLDAPCSIEIIGASQDRLVLVTNVNGASATKFIDSQSKRYLDGAGQICARRRGFIFRPVAER
jgi:hypothetical protein